MTYMNSMGAASPVPGMDKVDFFTCPTGVPGVVFLYNHSNETGARSRCPDH